MASESDSEAKRRHKVSKGSRASDNDIMPVIKVQNIVVDANLHASVDLYALSKKVRAVDYEPEQFPGAIFRIEGSKTIILFKNGKMICTGAKTEAEIRKVLAYASSVISKYVIDVNPPADKKGEQQKPRK